MEAGAERHFLRRAKGKPRKALVLQGLFQATRPGFEPGQREPKSLVLPLHYRVKFYDFSLITLLITDFRLLVFSRR